MDLVSMFIQRNSNGKKYPISGARIASALGVTGIEVRHMVNTARYNGDPVCSTGKGYYIAQSKDEVAETIDSLRGRIAAMSTAIEGLERYMRGA